MDLKLGDKFRCKRRGHVVEVIAFHDTVEGGAYAYYRNSRGSKVSIYIPRLLDASRFERVNSEVPAVQPVEAQASV